MNTILQWLVLTDLIGIGAVTVRQWLNYFKTPQALFAASLADWQSAGLTAKHISALKNPDWKTAEKNLHLLEAMQCHIINFNDVRYPEPLRQIYDAPILLYVQGDANLLIRSQLAIVGSRNPTRMGAETAGQFAEELARAGWVITSGLALGIDAASHRGALKANGKTLAVLGAGFQHIYPRSHQQLAKEIIAQGALVSEFLPNTLPKSLHFPMRNRIISGLSRGVLVVEAAVRSGSLITARLALEQNREVFAIPGSIHNPLARGCHLLIRQGAKLVETAQDILEETGTLTQYQAQSVPLGERQEGVDLDPKLQRVLAQIGYEVTALDVIIADSGLTTGELSSMLLSLELDGYVQTTPGGYVRIK